MSEIIAAVLSALLTVLLTWLFTRQQPSYVICEKEFSSRISLGFPNTKILYKNATLKSLYVHRYSLKNQTARVLDNAETVLHFSQQARVFDIVCSASPLRPNNEELAQINIEDNSAKVKIGRIYPYRLNQESFFIDIFSEETLDVCNVLGSGVFADSTPWTIVTKSGPSTTSRAINWFLNIFAPLVLIISILYSLWKYWNTPLLLLNEAEQDYWSNDFLFWIFLVLNIVNIITCFVLMWRGASLGILVPFTKYRIEIRMIPGRRRS